MKKGNVLVIYSSDTEILEDYIGGLNGFLASELLKGLSKCSEACKK